MIKQCIFLIISKITRLILFILFYHNNITIIHHDSVILYYIQIFQTQIYQKNPHNQVNTKTKSTGPIYHILNFLLIGSQIDLEFYMGFEFLDGWSFLFCQLIDLQKKINLKLQQQVTKNIVTKIIDFYLILLCIYQILQQRRQKIFQFTFSILFFLFLLIYSGFYLIRRENINSKMTQQSLFVLLGLILGLSSQQTQVNYILNSGFDFPTVGINSYQLEAQYNWTSHWVELCRYNFFTGYMNQFMDMQAGTYQNGYMEQQVELNYTSNCSLSYQQKAFSTNFASYIMQIYWNNVLQATKIANDTAVTLQQLQLNGLKGINVLKFKQIGQDLDGFGMWVDDVILTCIQVLPPIVTPNNTELFLVKKQPVDSSLLATYRPLPSDQIYSLSAILALPIKTKPAFQVLYLYTKDIWLYNYQNRRHYGVVNDIFNTVTLLQLMKLRFFENFLGFAKYSQSLPLSNYTDYTLPKFVEIEGSQSVLITSNFTFFIYTIPQEILTCLVLYAIFIMVSNKKISQCLRVFYFFRTVLTQSLIEDNLGYFSYVCFSHLSHPFAYVFPDKISLVFTIVFLFLIVTFTFSFYFLMYQYLEKFSGYFMLFFYRERSSNYMLTIKILGRSFIQGIAHFFLYNYYGCLLIFLSCIEAFVIASMVLLEIRNRIFLSKLSFCLQIIYHFLFILFNFSLYFQFLCSQSDRDYAPLRISALKLEQIFVYSLIIDSLLMFALEMLPKNCFSFNQQLQNNQNRQNVEAGRLRLKKRVKIFLKKKTVVKIKVKVRKGLLKNEKLFLYKIQTGQEYPKISFVLSVCSTDQVSAFDKISTLLIIQIFHTSNFEDYSYNCCLYSSLSSYNYYNMVICQFRAQIQPLNEVFILLRWIGPKFQTQPWHLSKLNLPQKIRNRNVQKKKIVSDQIAGFYQRS